MTDPITFAYLAMAVRSACPAEQERAYATFEGEIHTVDVVTSYAEVIDATYDSLVGDEGWDGVFAYDVVEPMGLFIMSKLASGTKPSMAEVQSETEQLIRQQLAA